MRLRLLARRTQAYAKAETAVVERQLEPVAERRPTILGGVVPTAATVHAIGAFKDRSPRTAVTRCCEIANS